jgi:hypothetical protein
VFAQGDGNPIPPERVTKRFSELAVELSIVSKQLGHSSPSITSDTYSHLLEGVGRDASQRAANLVPRTPRSQFVPIWPGNAPAQAPGADVCAGEGCAARDLNPEPAD